MSVAGTAISIGAVPIHLLPATYFLAILGSLLIVSPAPAAPSIAWLTQYGTSATAGDFGQGIAVDALGQSWVGGATTGNLGGTGFAGAADVFLSRISPTGNVDFTQQRGTSAEDYGTGVAILGSGTIFVGGVIAGAIDGQAHAGGDDAGIIQYNTIGVWQGTKLFGTSGSDFIGAVAASAMNLFTGGFSTGSFGGQTNAGSADAIVSKHDASGALLWTSFLGSSGDDQCYGVAVDAVGNSFITGYTLGNLPGSSSAGSYDFFVAKYDSNGNRTLLKQFGTSGVDFARGINVDISGNIYIAGYTAGNLGGETNAGSDDAFVTKLDSAGNVLWTRLFGGSFSSDHANALDVDGNGNVFIGGSSSGNVGTYTSVGRDDAFVVGYDTNGNLLGSQFLGSSGDDKIIGLSLGPDGGAYVTGYTDGSLGSPNLGGPDIFVAKIIGIPEPASALLLLGGGAMLNLRRRKQS